MTVWQQMTREQRIAAMKPLTAEGLTGAEIGNRLGTTRNAIIGMWHRHGQHFAAPKREARTPHRTQSAKPKGAPKPKPIKTPFAAALMAAGIPARTSRSDVLDPPRAPCPVIVAPPPPTGPGVSILDRQSDQCAWIMPERQDGLALCCGERAWRAGSAWCAYHARRVYAQPGDAPGKKSPVPVAPTFLEAAE